MQTKKKIKRANTQINESMWVEMLLSTYKKVESLHKKYDEPNDVIDSAINVLVRGPTLRDFVDYLDLLKNVVWTQGFRDVDAWIEHVERTCSEEEFKAVYILDFIHCLETEEEAPCEKVLRNITKNFKNRKERD